MPDLHDLEQRRASAKLAFEAAWRTGDYESEAWAMHELYEIDALIQQQRADENIKRLAQFVEAALKKRGIVLPRSAAMT